MIRPQTIPRGKLPAVFVCFFFSGMAGLIYQVAWVKALALVFGHTVYAVATVLAVFMGGLATGSVYVGRKGERHPNPVALYGRLELLAALTGALSLAGLHAVHSIYIASYPALSKSLPALLAMRFLGAAFVLFVPTFLMGGTFPILVSATANSSDEVTKRVSQLYWINAAGAVSGTLLAGFALLPAIGLRLTIGAAAALNTGAALIAFSIGKKISPRTLPSTVSSAPLRHSYPLLFFFGVVGCTALAYEIAWTRLLAITIGSSTYAFTLMLATFLAGIVIGSALFQLSASRLRPLSKTTLFWVQIGIGSAALSSLIAFHWIPALVPSLLTAMNRTFSGVIVTQLITAALTVIPAAIVFGFNFPLVVALIAGNTTSRAHTSTSVGTAYAANTIGAIIGSVVSGFWLIPWLGSFHVIAAVAIVNLLIALAIHLSSRPLRPAALAATVLLLVAAFLVTSSSFFYSQPLLSLSALLYGSSYQGRLTLSEIAATKDLVFTAEGVNDSVAVAVTDGDVALRVNGKVDASTEDTPTQLLLGHLGAAFHPSPRRVLVIGFGSGMTASAVARYPDVQQIDCVEIEPAVIRAAPYLKTLNRGVLRDPRIHIVFDDARNFLLTSRDKYDLIISEPSNPWIAGIATLFTDEYYAAARQRLQPGGSFVQWVQAYSLSPDDLRMIAATFARHFPEVTLWRGGETDLLLLGRTDASPFAFSRLRALWGNTALREDFASLSVQQPEGLVAYFLLDDRAVRQLCDGSNLNTDDRTLLEFDAPRSLLASSFIDVDQTLIAHLRTGPLPTDLAPSDAARALEAGLATALDLNDATSTQAFLEALASHPESGPHNAAKGRLALLQGALPQARVFFEKALKLHPESPEAAYWLAIAQRRSSNNTAALSRLNEILESHPNFLPALEEQMTLAADQQDFQTALSAQLKRMSLLPQPPAYEYGRLGALWVSVSNFKEAESILLKGLAQNPYCYACHFELGELYLRTGKYPLARQNFQWVVRFFPDSDVAAFRSLAAIDLLLRDTQSAKGVLEEGLRLFPSDVELLKQQASVGDASSHPSRE